MNDEERNPALAPEPEPDMLPEKQYKVVAVQSVLEHQPGEIFTAQLFKEQEAFYLTNGHLIEVTQEEETADSEGDNASVDSEPTEGATEEAEE